MRSRRCGIRRAQEEVEGPRPQLPITAMPALFENDVPPADLIISREFTERIRVCFFSTRFVFRFFFLPHTVAGSAVYAASDTCITNIDRFKNTVFTSLGRKLLVETEKTKSKMILFRQEQSPCRRTTSHPLPFIIIIRMPLVFCFVVVSVCVCVCVCV